MRNCLYASIRLVVLCVMLAQPALGWGDDRRRDADDPQSKPRPSGETAVVLDDIVVKDESAKQDRLAWELAQTGRLVEIVSGETLQEAGFVDLVQALDTLVPGFFTITRAGRGSYTFPKLHGSDSILWLLDGAPMNDRLYGGAYPSTISVHMIERIEILKGGESLFYGTAATAGVINIVTKAIPRQTGGELGISYGARNYMETFGHVGGNYKDHGWMAFGGAETWDGYVPCDDQAYRDALNPNKKTSAEYDRGMLGAKYRRAFDLRGQGVLNFQIRKHQGAFDYAYPTYQTADTRWEESLAVLKWDHDLSQTFSYHIKSTFHSWWSRADFAKLDGSFLFNDELWGYDSHGINLMTNTRWGRGHALVIGADYQTYKGAADAWNPGVRGHDVNSLGLFAQYRPYLGFSPQTRLGVGGRYENTGETDTAVWDVSLKTPLFGEIYARGHAGATFTLPNVVQLYGDNASGTKVGNPALRPETSVNTQIGLGGHWRYLQLDAGYFRHTLEDRISTIRLDQNRTTYKNVDGKTDIDGFEITATIGPGYGLSLIASATWTRAEDEDTSKQLEQIPEFFSKGALRYRHPAGHFGADLTARYVGALHERDLAPFADVTYGDYYLLDTSCFVAFGKNNRRRLTLRAENLLDADYATIYYRNINIGGDPFVYHYSGPPPSLIIGYTHAF